MLRLAVAQCSSAVAIRYVMCTSCYFGMTSLQSRDDQKAYAHSGSREGYIGNKVTDIWCRPIFPISYEFNSVSKIRIPKQENRARLRIEVRPIALTLDLNFWPWPLIPGEWWSWPIQLKGQGQRLLSSKVIHSGNRWTDGQTLTNTLI